MKGKNGFVCVVERSWGSDFEDPEFWNPKIRAPVCCNPASRTIHPARESEEAGDDIGRTLQTQVFDGIKAAFAKKELPTAEPGLMCYMMSKEAYLNDRGRHDLAHLMSEVPRMDFLVPEDVPEPTTEFIVRVEKWSDGTPAPTDTH